MKYFDEPEKIYLNPTVSGKDEKGPELAPRSPKSVPSRSTTSGESDGSSHHHSKGCKEDKDKTRGDAQ